MDITQIQKLDVSNVYGSIQQLSDQIVQVISEIDSVVLPEDYKKATNGAIAAMGGSLYSYYVLQSLFAKQLIKPISMINGYDLPAYITADTCTIASSYSGTTEETIQNAKHLIEKKYPTIIVTSGGELGTMISNNSQPGFIFNPIHNPCGQPRVGVGYMIFAPILLLNKLGFLNIDIEVLKRAALELKANDNQLQEIAQSAVEQIKEQIVILTAAEHLSGAVHIGRNQLNETAKTFAEYHLIPELNHHLMEGLTYPADKKPFFLLYESTLYSERIKARFAITRQVLDKQNVKYHTISVAASDTISEFLQIMQINSFMSFFLGLSHDIDPALVPWVDYFKSELKKL